MFELPSLKTTAILETATSFEVEAIVSAEPAACPGCGGRLESKGIAAPCTIWDSPSGGKHVRIVVRGRRYRCVDGDCPSITFRGPDIDSKRYMTRRLADHIRASSLRRSIADISDMTGASPDQIWPVVSELAQRLARHRFDTPPVVAVDDLRFGKERRYTVIYDGETGHALGIVKRLDAKGVGKKLADIIDPKKAKVFVTDMNGSNVRLGKHTFKGIPHVADKWHVLDKLQRALSRTINQTANGLPAGPRAELKEWKKELEGKYAAADAKARKAMLSGKPLPKREDNRASRQGLKLRTKWDILKLHRAVRTVYHARLLLRHVYRASSRSTAEQRFDRLLAFGQSPSMPDEAAKAIERLGGYRKHILAYFDAISQHHDGRYRGPTTNQAECRNAKIKSMWKSSKGIRNQDYLNLRVVFEPYVLGVSLILCERCGDSELLPPDAALRRAGIDMRDPRARLCSACACPEALVA